MRTGRRDKRDDDWDDDWDDEVRVEEQPSDTNTLSTRTILWGLLLVAVVAVVIGSVVSRDEFQFEESPSRLLGTWICEDPGRSDLWVEFRPQFVIFGTGGTGSLKYRILGIKFEQVGEVERYTVFYRDLAGKEHNREVVVTPPGDSFRFADEPGVKWSRYGV
jgi:hypothetical protein